MYRLREPGLGGEVPLPLVACFVCVEVGIAGIVGAPRPCELLLVLLQAVATGARCGRAAASLTSSLHTFTVIHDSEPYPSSSHEAALASSSIWIAFFDCLFLRFLFFIFIFLFFHSFSLWVHSFRSLNCMQQEDERRKRG
jgi:hypothetical protein